MTLAAKLLTELLGTFLFFTVIALAGLIGPLAPLAIGGAARRQARRRRSLKGQR